MRRRLEYPAKRVLYETAGWISHPRFSRRGDLLAFIDHPDPGGDDAGAIVVISLDGKRRAFLGGWKSAQGLAWSVSGREVWFTAAQAGDPFAQNALRALDLAGHTRMLMQTTGRLKLEDVSAAGKALTTQPNAHLGLAVIPTNETAARDLSWLDLPMLEGLAADGSVVLVTEHGAGAQPNCETFLRRADGSPPLSLGSGRGAALSPDGKWVLSIPCFAGAPGVPSLLPVGPGEARPLALGGLSVEGARWFPDGSRLVLVAAEPGHAPGLYLLELESTNLRSLHAEGLEPTPLAVSPDGAWIAALGPGKVPYLYATSGGAPVRVAAAAEGDRPVGFDSDGSLFVVRRGDLTGRIFRIDLRRGTRALWKTLSLPGPSAGLGRVMVSPGGKAIAFNYQSLSAHLYLVEGLE